MRPFVVLVAVAACAAGCGGARHDIVHKPGEAYVSDIQIDGNDAISDEDLRGGLAQTRTLGVATDVDPYQTELDAQRIKGAYLRIGYFTVDVQARVEKHGDARTIRYTIKEGPRARVAAVTFVGLPPELPEAKARALVKLADGAPFDYDPYDDAKDEILRLIEDAGYAHARLDANVEADRVHAQATLQYQIVLGPHCTFGDVSIEGVPEGGLADAIRARVAFHRGDPYKLSPIQATQRALYGVGRFSTVRVQPVLGDETNSIVAVKIVVSEANRHEFRVGPGAGLDPLDYTVRLHATYSQAGVFDPLTTFSAEALPELAWLRDTSGESNDFTGLYRLIGRLTRQDFLFTNWKGEVEGGLDYLTIEDYTDAGERARLGISAPLGTDKLQVRVGWTFGLYEFSQISAAVDAATAQHLGLDSVERLGEYTQAISLDLRDSPIEPTRGIFASFQIAEGSKYALGGLDFTEIQPVLRGYVPLPFGLVLAGRIHYAAIDGDVPATERFFGGGASSNRGFSERRMSPTASNELPDGTIATVAIGGAGLLETGVELRESLPDKLGLVGFLDGGDCTDTVGELDAELDSHVVSNLNWAAGVGARYQTPIGPVRVDFAYRLNRYGPTDPDPGSSFSNRFQWFIGVGEAF